jgi:acetylornithine deacetylase
LQPHLIPAESTNLAQRQGKKSYNLFVTLGDKKDGGVLLSGHSDVVPAFSEGWNSDPFVLQNDLTGKDEKYYGRGTSDMKGFLACILAMVPFWLSKHSRNHTDPIHLAFTYDEEIGCIGVDDLIKEIGNTLPKPEAVIVGEPTLLQPVNGHKSAARYRTVVTGKAAHSSCPSTGVNAIYAANKIVWKLQDVFSQIEGAGAQDSPYNASLFHPPYSTISLGTISGGSAINVVAEKCELRWEARMLPWEEPHQYMGIIEEFCHTISSTQNDKKALFTTTIESFLPGLIPETNSKAYQYYSSMMSGQGQIPQSPATVSFGTEAGKYNQAGIPALIWGPGSIAQAHTNNEYIEKSQLSDCCTLLSYL